MPQEGWAMVGGGDGAEEGSPPRRFRFEWVARRVRVRVRWRWRGAWRWRSVCRLDGVLLVLEVRDIFGVYFDL
jgi:hypothetical protein